jgi:hypothetical protein
LPAAETRLHEVTVDRQVRLVDLTRRFSNSSERPMRPQRTASRWSSTRTVATRSATPTARRLSRGDRIAIAGVPASAAVEWGHIGSETTIIWEVGSDGAWRSPPGATRLSASR